MSNLGNVKIKRMPLGKTEIAKAFLGTDLVFKKEYPVFYDRLIFDGVAYIDTDITPLNGDSFNVIIGNETMKAAQRVFTMDTSSGGTVGLIYSSNTNTTRRMLGNYYGGSGASRQLNWTTTSFNYFLTPNRYGYDNSSYTLTKANNAISSHITIGMNVAHTGQAFTGGMGTFYIYGSDAAGVTTASGFSSYTPKYTLRPCTYKGVAGLWCVETGKFYGNSNSTGALSVANV